MYPAAQKDPRGGHNKIQINHSFFQTWSAQMAYVLGFIFADGAIEDVQKSSRTCYLSIVCTSKDVSILDKIRGVMNSKHRFYIRAPQSHLFLGGKYYTSAQSFVYRNSCYRLAYSTKSSEKILEFMYKDLDKAPFLDRKFAIYQKYLNKYSLIPPASHI